MSNERDMMWLLAIGILLNSALYLSACFVAGLVLGNAIAWRLAIAAMGVTYLAYLGQFDRRIVATANWLAQALVVLSIGLGAAAGIALLF